MGSAVRHGLLIGAVVLTGAIPAGGAELALKRVVLSTGGVGYLESEAVVDGDASVTLDVPLDQVDDVLKSLIVFDSEGSAGEITLPGREPLTQSFSDLPFDRNALNSAVDLLNALQGAEIRVSAPRAISGRLVHADQEAVAVPGGVVETRTWVGVMTDTGLQRFSLREVDAVTFTDPELQKQVTTALSRIAAYRATGRRQLTLRTHGSGRRTIRVGYVVGMPLWKASYRLSLPADAKAESARLQGWAVLENFSGRGWKDVELTLLSGNPVTFRQALYESYYVPRPSVPVESGGRVLPPADTGSVGTAAGLAKAEEPAENRARRDFALAAPASRSVPPAPPPIAAASAEEAATQVAFTPPYKISVEAGQSLVLPLLDRDLPAHRVDLYQPSVDRLHPLAAVELSNKSGTGLPPGVLTIYQQGEQGALYLGDARLASFPSGDKRLLSFAVDNKVTVDSSSSERRPITKARIADGVLHLSRSVRWTTSYRVKTSAAPPNMLIEQARNAGATLTSPDPKTVELMPGAYRIPFTVPASGEGGLDVVEEQPVEETIRLFDVDDNRLGALVSSTEIDAKTRQVLGEIGTRRQKVGQQKAELKRLQDRRGQLVDDQKRLRDNLAVLGNDASVHKRMLDKFNETETAMESTTTAIATATDALSTSERDLAAYIKNLSI